MYYFFVYAFIFLAAGILFSYFTEINIPLIFPVLLFSISLLFKSRFSVFISAISFFLTGISLYQNPLVKNIEIPQGFVDCRVSSVPRYSNDYTIFSCKVLNSDKKILKEKEILVIYRNTDRNIFLGSEIAFFGKFFSDRNKILSFPYIGFLKVDNSHNYLFIFQKLKNFLISRFNGKTLSKESKILGHALIFGEKGDMNQKIKNEFINAGTSHLLAISGMHVGIIMLILLFVFSFNKKLSYLITGSFLLFYPLLTGLHIPVVRASLMGILYIASKIKYLKINPINILFFVGFLVLLLSPKSLFDVSFQLSFVAVLGLLLYIDFIQRNIRNRVFNFLYKSVIMSVIAVIFTVPVVLYYFGKFSLTTIIATPVLIIILFPYLILSVINLFTLFSVKPLINLMDIIGIIFLKINSFFAGLKFVHTGFSPGLWLVIAYLLIAILLSFLKISKPVKFAVLLFLFFTFLTLSVNREKTYRIYTFKGFKYPVFAVITPYGECFYSKDTFRVKQILNKNLCRKTYSVRNIPDTATTKINLIKEKGKIKIVINNREFLLENKDNFLRYDLRNTDIQNKALQE